MNKSIQKRERERKIIQKITTNNKKKNTRKKNKTHEQGFGCETWEFNKKARRKKEL